jgi:hypothetical protein
MIDKAACIMTGMSSALICVTLASAPASAQSSSLAVQLACAGDYYAYCSRHDPDSAGARSCMRINGQKLSQRCINALVAAGEVTKAEVARRASLRK